MMTLTEKALTNMNSVMEGHISEYDINDTYSIEHEINQMRNNLKKDNIRAVDEHEYSYAVGTVYNDFINECEKLGDYAENVVQARFGI